VALAAVCVWETEGRSSLLYTSRIPKRQTRLAKNEIVSTPSEAEQTAPDRPARVLSAFFGKEMSCAADRSPMPKVLNRRNAPRSKGPAVQGLELTVAAPEGVRRIAARLVDFSEHGVGLEMAVPLKVGSEVEVHGNLTSSDLDLRIDGNAQVAHTQRLRGGNYRIGLSLDQLAYRKSA